ncbi:MAG: gliding motility-associated C-terminal domain-containing protein [Bacteroidetes bacterium]|nr:gliding motility-associated C-terminal domain-containing protein [Bacteroidota bacterium]
MLFYQNTFRGGCSFDGVTYVGTTWTFSDTMHFKNTVPSGCSLKKAFLMSLKETCKSFGVYPTHDAPISFDYNNHIIQFDTTTNGTPMFFSGTGGSNARMWVAVKDVTEFTQNNNNILVTPLQGYTNTCGYYYYDSFFLLLLYENSSYNNINVAVYLNNMNQVVPTMTYPLNNLNPINTTNDIGLSIESWDVAVSPYVQYQLTSSTSNVNLGTLRIVSIDNANDYKTGFGSFHYENGTLSGLVDDSNTPFIDTTDALANIKTYLPNNATDFTVTANTSTLPNIYDDDMTIAFLMAYSTPCPATPSNVDSIKVHTFCNNAAIQLQATSGYASYAWYPKTGLSDTSVANPMLNTQSCTNYICYVKDTAGCMHTEHTQIIVHQAPAPQNINSTLAICGAMPSTLSITPNPHNYGYTYSLNNNPPQTSTSYTNLTAGQYTLNIKDTALGCIYTTTLAIKDTNLAQAAFYPSPSTGCAPLTISCQNMSNNIKNVTNNWVWYTNGDSSISQNFHYTFLDTGVYKISLLAYQNLRTCSATTSQTISVSYCPPDSFSLAAPNIFSPNGDGINDTWQPIIHNYQYSLNSYQCTLYDRWGNKVFANNNPTPGWSGKAPNGEAAPAGTYFYIINYKATGNSQGTVQENSLKGFIELIR